MVIEKILMDIIDQTIELKESCSSNDEILDYILEMNDENQKLMDTLIDACGEESNSRWRDDTRREIYGKMYDEIYENEIDNIRETIESEVRNEFINERNEYFRELLDLEVVEKNILIFSSK